MPPNLFTSSGQNNTSASQPMNNQLNASAAQPTTQSDASQLNAQVNASASQSMTQRQHATSFIQPVTPTEVLISRVPHQSGVNWVFRDPMTGGVRHVNVPYIHSMAQQSVNPSASQPIATNAMALHQQIPSQTSQPTPQITSANQSVMPNLSPQHQLHQLQFQHLPSQCRLLTGRMIGRPR